MQSQQVAYHCGSDSTVNVIIKYVSSPPQLDNECPVCALKTAMGLALEVSNGLNCLQYEAKFTDGNRKVNVEVGATVNVQSDNLRTLISLGFVKPGAWFKFSSVTGRSEML